MTTLKSVITCDLEGRIETFNDDAEQLFGWTRSEVVGKKRVSLFSPGLVVLGHIGRWLAEARRTGEHRGTTVFLRKDGTPFAADIRITPTRRDGVQIGYCGVTVPRPDVQPETVWPRISLGTRIFSWMVVTRAPFLTATIVPVLVGAAYAAQTSAGPFPWLRLVAALVGAVALHVAANTFNDYFDWTSGADPENDAYFMPFTGGSRAIELGLVRPRGLLVVAWSAAAVAAVSGAWLATLAGPQIIALGVAGLAAAYFYTAPPLRLVARKGLGELLVGLCFGPLVVAGTSCALTGELTTGALVAGLPVGLLTTAILWVNEFPDAPSDARVGKRNLVVVLGTRAARWGYLALLVSASAAVALGIWQRTLPLPTLLFFVASPLAAYAAVVVLREYDTRKLARANAATIGLHLVAGLAFALGLVL